MGSAFTDEMQTKDRTREGTKMLPAEPSDPTSSNQFTL
jgi:hypothetical protein